MRTKLAGNCASLAGRVIIVPYLRYDGPAELAVIDQCAARAASADDYYRRFHRQRDGRSALRMAAAGVH